MIVIYKYPFRVADRVEVAMPRGAMVLKIETQAGTPFLWAMVDTEAAVESHRFLVFGTGHAINSGLQRFGEHVATFQEGPFVWHVFRVRVAVARAARGQGDR